MGSDLDRGDRYVANETEGADLSMFCYLRSSQRPSLPVSQDNAGEQVESQLTDVLARTQILLAFLFPSRTRTVDKAAALLHLGKPSGGQEYQPAVELVKPSPRLGLLLV